MSSPIVIPQTEGLNTHGNDLAAPVGSTSVADNVTFSREGRPERRNGFKDYSSNLPDYNPAQLIASAAGDQAYLHLDNGIWYHDGTNWLRKAGTGANLLNNPLDVVYLSGFLYLCEQGGYIIRKIDLSTGDRPVMAGRFGVSGTTDGTGGAARFTAADAICTDGTNLFVCDNHGIRKIVISSGVVTTLAGTVASSGSADSYYIPAAAQWTNHDASSDAAWGSVTYASSLGSGSGRLCAIETGVASTKAMTSDDGGATWTARTLPSSRTWKSVTWASELTLFVAVASDGALSGRVATSADGITWTSRTAADGQWASVAWNGTMLVAVSLSGGPNFVMTSADGITWTARTGINGYWTSVAWSTTLSLWAAVGQFDTGFGQVQTSPDGITWTARTASSTNQWTSVAWSTTAAKFAAVSLDGTGRVQTSADGITWTARTEAEANQWWGICWSESFGVFIAVAIDGANRIEYSRDGITWTAVAAPDAKQWTAIVDAPLISRVVSTAVADLDSVMRATTSGASLGGGTFSSPEGICTDNTNLFVSDSGNHTVRKVVISTGFVTTLAGTAGATGTTDATGSAARFNSPRGISYDSGSLYVCDLSNHRIRKVVASSGVVTTLAGSSVGYTDGTGTGAQFSSPFKITSDGTNLYVSDQGNTKIRKIVISSTVVSSPFSFSATAGNHTDGIGSAGTITTGDIYGITIDTTNNAIYFCAYSKDVLRKIYVATEYVYTIDGRSGVAAASAGDSDILSLIVGPD